MINQYTPSCQPTDKSYQLHISHLRALCPVLTQPQAHPPHLQNTTPTTSQPHCRRSEPRKFTMATIANRSDSLSASAPLQVVFSQTKRFSLPSPPPPPLVFSTSNSNKKNEQQSSLLASFPGSSRSNNPFVFKPIIDHWPFTHSFALSSSTQTTTATVQQLVGLAIINSNNGFPEIHLLSHHPEPPIHPASAQQRPQCRSHQYRHWHRPHHRIIQPAHDNRRLRAAVRRRRRRGTPEPPSARGRHPETTSTPDPEPALQTQSSSFRSRAAS
ncbi:hypothetical protein BD289DRAFT_442023 [Coniella lustricola]|uniref:Uncharacterized protein n=1 Tax=Coniella lustricola TaxID=2025994 RepID=A0A2T2ZYL4_9PEZI|nr:hypothetical protein BD289DRAFT_442023 [Coniella lustricola]